jgi:hypothetical protein
MLWQVSLEALFEPVDLPQRHQVSLDSRFLDRARLPLEYQLPEFRQYWSVLFSNTRSLFSTVLGANSWASL